MSQRKEIRHALRALLMRIVLLNEKVFVSRAVPVIGEADEEAYDLPCVLVYTDRDPSSDINGFARKRDLVVRIVAIVRADDQADDELDGICEAIESTLERAFNRDGTLEDVDLINLAESFVYNDTELSYTGADGRAELVHASMSFTCTYYTARDRDYPELREVRTEFDMASPRNDPQDVKEPDGQIDARASILFDHD